MESEIQTQEFDLNEMEIRRALVDLTSEEDGSQWVMSIWVIWE